MKIGFWNINKKDLSDLIATLTIENDLDIVCLAEASSETRLKFLTKINRFSIFDKFNQIACSKEKVTVFSRYAANVFEDKSYLYNSNRFIAQKIKLPTIIEFNLIVMHFHSKSNWSDISLAMECATTSAEIKKVERDTKNKNTIVIGDFNMDPYESGMIAANGFHAIPDLEYASKVNGREIDKTFYQFFYNPMWNFFGDHREPLGTYYYRSSGSVSYDWHIFDQVLIRPSLIKHLNEDCIEIVTKIGSLSLINNYKRPDSSQYSDHLPIILKIKI